MANNGTAPDLQAIRDEITRIYNSTEDYTQQANMQPYNSGMTRDQIASIYYDGAVPSANDIPVLQPTNQQPIQAQTPTQKQNIPTTTQKPQKDVGMEMAKEIGKQALKDAKSSVYGQGNIDLHNRPKYRQNDGSISTVNSMSFQDENGKEVLIPTIAYDKNGKPTQLTDDEAIDRYYQTGEYLGKFNTVDEADKYAQKLHKDQEDYYLNGGNKRSLSANEQRDMERAMNARKEAEDRRKKTVTETVKTEEQLSGNMPSEITSGTVNKRQTDLSTRNVMRNQYALADAIAANTKRENGNANVNTNAYVTVVDDAHPDGYAVPAYMTDDNGNILPEYKDVAADSYKNQIEEINNSSRINTQETPEQKIDRYTSPDYQLSKEEKKDAKALVKDYFDNNPTAKTANNTNNANLSATLIANMSEDERNEYARMVTLQDKTSGLSSYAKGSLSSVPFLKSAEDKVSEMAGIDPQYNFSAQLQNAQTQNPLLYGAGDMTTKLAEYSTLSPLLEQIPVVGQVTNGLGTALAGGNAAVGNAIGSVMRGTLADVALDTIPREIQNAQNGMGFADIATDAAGSIAGNTLFNTIGEAAPYAWKGAKNLINGLTNKGAVDQAADAARSALNNELNPLEAAAKNADEFTEQSVKNNAANPVDNGVSSIYDETKGGLDNDTIQTGNEYDRTGSEGILRENSGNGSLGSRVSAAGVSGGEYLPSDRISVSNNVTKNAKVFDDNDIKNLTDSNIPYNEYYDLKDSDTFSKALATAKANNPHGGAVDAHTAEEIQDIIDRGGKTFLTADGTAGGAVDNGNLTAVFKDNLNNDTPRAASTIAIAGVKNGAVKGDCFGRFLVNSYSRAGFEPVARVKYTYGLNDEMDRQVREQLASGLIDREPDVYALKLIDGYDYNKAIQNYGQAKKWTQQELDSLRLFEGENAYDDMLAYRDSLMKKQPTSEGAFFDGSNSSEITQPDVTPVAKKVGESAPEITNKPVNTETGNMPEKGSGERQISKYRTNSMKKLDSVNEQNMPTEDFGYNRFSVEEQTQQGIERWGNNPNAVRDLQNKESWDEVDSRYAQDRWTELMESENEDDLKEALKLARKQSYELREGGRLVQTAAGMDDIASRMNMARQEMNAAVDKAHGVGTSEALDNVATQLDVSLSDADLGTKEGREKVADIVSKKLKNRTLRDYAPSNKAMKSAENVKKFQNTDKIISKIKDGKYKNVDDLIADVYRQNGGVPISSADQKNIYNLLNLASTMEDGSYTQEIVLARAAKTAMKGAPSTLGEKARSVLYANMLGNFKTAVSRNAFGNFGFQVLEQARSPIAALVDSATSLATKQRSVQGWNIGKAKAYGRGLVKGAKEQAGDIARGTNTGRSGSTGWANALKENKHTWNEAGKTEVGNAIAKMANGAEFYVSSAMKMGDRPFFEANFAQRQTELHQLVNKYGKERVAGLSDIPDELLDDTIDMMSAVHAADSVFQKKGKIAEGLSDIRNGLGKTSEGALGIDILSTSSAPFTLTPGNMLTKAIEYSPLGLVRNAINTGKEIANKSFNQKRFVDELSRTITGLPVLGAAYGLAKNGMISGGYSDDEDEKAQQIADDYIEYGFTNPLTGRTYDTSDIPVLGSFMQAAGAIAEDGFTPEALMQGAEAITLGSAMQGLRKAFGGDVGYSSSGSMLDSLKDTALSSLTQLVPSLLRQTAQTSDKYKRDLGEYKTGEYYLNNVLNSIPILRQTLPEKYDSEGNQILQNQGRPLGNKIAENYLLPMKVSEYKQSELTQEALRLKNETDGDNRAFVPKAKRGDTKDWAKKAEKEYSEEMFYDYKKDFGELNKKAGEFVIHSDFYNSLDPETQVNVLSDVYSAMKQVAKNHAVGLDTDDKLANTYMNAEDAEQGLNDILESLTYKYNPYGIDADAYKKMLDSNENMDKYEGYKDALSQYDVEDNKAYRDAYAEGGAEKLGEEIGYQSALKDAGLSDSKSNRNDYAIGGADRLNSVADNKAKAIELGFTDADGSANTKAYQNALEVFGNDASAKSYAGFANTMREMNLTKQEQYIPRLEATSMTNEQKGQYAYLYGGVKAGSSAEKVLKDKGYEYFYLYRLLQNPEDLNNNGKKDPGDRAKTLYNWGFDNKSDAYRYFIEGDLSY